MGSPVGKSILFIPDLSSNAGMGHFYRCLRCAAYLSSVGWRTSIIGPAISPRLSQMIKQGNVTYHRLNNLNAQSVAKFANSQRNRAEWLITDHYKLAAPWEKKLRSLSKIKIAVFDDDDGRAHKCDLLIRTNELVGAAENRRSTALLSSARVLSGPRFYIPEIGMRRSQRKQSKSVRSILFFIGGAADAEIFLRLLDATILALRRSKVKLTAIVPTNFNATLPRHIAKNVTLVRDYKLLGKLLACTDLFVGSGGTITFDRLLFGIPGIVFSLAPNQNKLSSSLAKRGANIFLGSADKLSSQKLTHAITSVLRRPKLYNDLRARSCGIVDGLGGHRLNMQLLHFPIELRYASTADEKRILIWRNTSQVRAASISSEKISPRKHHQWFQQKLGDKNCALLIAESRHGAVAVLRYDLFPNKSCALVSIFLTPAVMGSGLGSEVLKAGTVWLRRKFKKVRRINATIRVENIASIRSFLAAGYRKTGKYYVKYLR